VSAPDAAAITWVFTEGRKGMRRLTLVVAAGLALVATSLAVGALMRDRSMSAVSATFTATTVGTRATTTCTNGDGTFQITRGTYTGTASGDPALSGPIRLMVNATINTTKRLGTIDGAVVVDRAGRDTRARLTGVYRDGSVSGMLFGAAMPPGERLLGTFTASYSSDGGFGAGGIGVGNVDPVAISFTDGACNAAKPASGQLKLIGGTVQTLTDGTLTVALVAGGSFSCSLDDQARAEIARQDIKQGDQVTAFCTYRAGTWTLLHVKKLAVTPGHGKKKR
jgi:hypothetical protein